MGLISRPAKEGGFLTYAAKVLAGFTLILDTEVDADFDTMYAGFNGNITDENIADAAGIDPDKIAPIPYANLILTGSIVNADIAAAAAIARTKLQTRNASFALITAGLNVGVAETSVWSLPSFEVVGSSVVFLPATGCWVLNDTSELPATLTWRWKRNGTTMQTIQQSVGSSAISAADYPIQPPAFFDLVDPPGLYGYELTVQSSSAHVKLRSGASNPGGIYAVEV